MSVRPLSGVSQAQWSVMEQRLAALKKSGQYGPELKKAYEEAKTALKNAKASGSDTIDLGGASTELAKVLSKIGAGVIGNEITFSRKAADPAATAASQSHDISAPKTFSQDNISDPDADGIHEGVNVANLIMMMTELEFKSGVTLREISHDASTTAMDLKDKAAEDQAKSQRDEGKALAKFGIGGMAIQMTGGAFGLGAGFKTSLGFGEGTIQSMNMVFQGGNSIEEGFKSKMQMGKEADQTIDRKDSDVQSNMQRELLSGSDTAIQYLQSLVQSQGSMQSAAHQGAMDQINAFPKGA